MFEHHQKQSKIRSDDYGQYLILHDLNCMILDVSKYTDMDMRRFLAELGDPLNCS